LTTLTKITQEGDSGAVSAPFGVTVTTLAVVGMVVVGQMYVAIPILPEIGAAWHTSQEAATWATSAFALAYAVGSLVSGHLSNRFGGRAVMAGSVAMMAVVTALVPIGSSLGEGSFLRASQGFLAGAFVPMAYSYLSSRIPARRLPMALTVVSCAMGATVVVGQVEGQLLAAAFGWSSVFWITAPLLALGAVVTWKVLLPGDAGQPAATPLLRTTNRLGRLVPLYLVTLAIAGSLTAIYTGVQLYGPEQLVGDPDAMLALRASALPALLIIVLLAPLFGAFGALTRAAGGFVVAAAGMLGAAVFVDSAVGLGVAIFIFIMGIAAVGPAIVQAVGNAAGGSQPVAIAVYGFALNLGGAAGAQLPLLVGGLADLTVAIAGITGISVVIILASAGLSRARAHRHPSTSV